MKKKIQNLFTLAILFLGGNAFTQTRVLFYTNKGNFTVELNDQLAPITSKNFKDLVTRKFYDGIIFHRVIDNFMIQGGDPTGTGEGGSGDIIPDEFHEDLSNLKTTISMANAGPNTADSQFFINLKDNTYLDFNKPPETSKHAVFGKVVSNFEVVEAIGKVKTNSNDKPLEDVVMDSLRIESPVGINPVNNGSEKLSFFPNPVTHTSSFYIRSKKSDVLTITMFDGLGKKVLSEKINVNEGRNIIPFSNIINTNYLKQGLYQISIVGSETEVFQKIMVQ